MTIRRIAVYTNVHHQIISERGRVASHSPPPLSLSEASLLRAIPPAPGRVLPRLGPPVAVFDVAVSRPSVPADLYAALLVAASFQTLAASDVVGRPPDDLGVVGVFGIGPGELVLDPPSHDLVSRGLVAPRSGALVQGQILPILKPLGVDERGAAAEALIRQRVGVGLGLVFQNPGPTEGDVALAAVVLAPAVVVRL